MVLTGVYYYYYYFALILNILSYYLIFVILITMSLGMILFQLILSGSLCASCTWMSVSFPRLGKFSATMSSDIFSVPFSLSSPSETPVMRILVHLKLSQRPLKMTSFLSIFSVQLW